MKEIGTIFIVIFVLVLLYLAYKFFIKKSENGTPCSSTGGSVNDGTIISGVCVKSDTTASSTGPTPPIVYDYFVNGDANHDKQIFSNGLNCAKAFLYKNTTNDMANSVMASLGRPGAISGACNGFNCRLAGIISTLNQQDKDSLLNYVLNLQADTDWKRFSNMAIGNKNMCSVILEEAVRQNLPGVWAVSGRG